MADQVDQMQAIRDELARWRVLGAQLWPMIRLWPVSGACGAVECAIVEEFSSLMQAGKAVNVDLVKRVREEAIDEVAAYLEESGKIKRVNPTERDAFINSIKDLKSRE